MKRWFYFIAGLVVASCIAGILICSTGKKENNDKEYYGAFTRTNRVFSLEMPEKLDICGEMVPLDEYYVREGLDRELHVNTYWHSNTILMLKRAYRYFPVIEPVLKENNVPDDFKYLALIESGFMNVVSPAGATGFWQFLKSTGEKYGLEITDEVDERYHLEKSTEAACKYLKESYELYKSWTLAAASYNAGTTGISKKLEHQKADNYYDLYLNSETARYVFRILALKLIYSNPARYGFYLRYKDLYPPIPVYTISVDKTIDDLAAFAIANNTKYRILKEFNPWLRRQSLSVKNGKSYDIQLPKPGFTSYKALQNDIKNIHLLFNDTLKVEDL